ncbi:unnamed protein product [Schistosoma margrebowiei]|uniref:Uncharacterized protein n=1 Tax=Schistosoma margrebowiei TaxID=48269 RepID=A0A183MQB8_9TREM|nr:unnamed protein product [Schistosoma margrebowiei]
MKAVLYTDNESTPHYWSPDLADTSTTAYINLATSFCNLLLQGLKLGKPSFSENAKCVNVLFIPVDLVIRQKRQINTNGSLGQNTTQGVQGTADVQIASPEAAVLNSTSVTQIISSGISQLNTSFGVQLSNLEISSISSNSTTESSTSLTSTQTQSVTINNTQESTITITTTQTKDESTTSANTTGTVKESSTLSVINTSFTTSTSVMDFNASTTMSILTTKASTDKLTEITSTFSSQSTQSVTNLFTNASTLTTVETTTTTTIYVNRVSTAFQVKAIIYAISTGRCYFMHIKSYFSLFSIQFKLLQSLLTQNTQITRGATCTFIGFIRTTINSPSKRQIQSSNNITTDAVQGNAQTELQTLAGSQLNQAQFSQILFSGYQKLNLSSGNYLTGVDTTRISPTITCSQTRSLCGEHASCRNTDNGVTCTCDPMWKDVNPEDPGKNCTRMF